MGGGGIEPPTHLTKSCNQALSNATPPRETPPIMILILGKGTYARGRLSEDACTIQHSYTTTPHTLPMPTSVIAAFLDACYIACCGKTKI